MTDDPEAVVGAVDPPPALDASSFQDWVQLLRLPQWIKNCFVLAPLLFSGQASDITFCLLALAAFAAFCLLSSGVYAINDSLDEHRDRRHPVKRRRPVAAGRIPARSATFFGMGLIGAGAAVSYLLGHSFLAVGAGYVALNLAYSKYLKLVVIVDVFVLAALFVLRLIAGAVVIGVRPTIWLILCGGLLALYLGFAKRRHEIVVLGNQAMKHRSVLGDYSAPFLDQMSSILLSVTIVSYVMYTLTSQTASMVGSELLAYSSIFVLYGVFRYLYLVHERGRGSPTETLLTDRWLLIDILFWLLYCGWVLYRPAA